MSFLTGFMGEALERSNARLAELLGPGQKPAPGCPFRFNPQMAQIGESIYGGPDRRAIPWLGAAYYNRVSESGLSRPKPVMTEETKKRLRSYAKDRVRDNGDPISQMLRKAVTLDETYAAGAEYLGLPEAELRARYGHLNHGQQRMNIGNLMRGKFRRDHPGQLPAKVKKEKTEPKVLGLKATGKPKRSKK